MRSYQGDFMREAELRGLGAARVGENVAVHRSCVLVGLENMQFGSNVRIDPFTVLTAAGGWLRVGDFVHIATHVFVSAGCGVEVCDFVSLSPGAKVFSRSDDFSGEYLTNPTLPAAFTAPSPNAPVRIGRHVLVGAGSVVLPEVDIGDGSSVGANSVVTGSLEAGGVYAGAPARLVRPRRRDIFEQENRLRAAVAAGEAVLPVARL